MSEPYEAMIWLGFEERAELEALSRLLGAGDTFVDCGANIGLWSLSAASLVGANGRVIAFEANPITAARLTDNVRDQPNVEVRAVALDRTAGEARLQTTDRHNVSRVSAAGDLVVPATSLDEALDGAVPAGIKLDVEGHELAVLQGAAATLGRHPGWIAVEFSREHREIPVLGAWDVHDLLRRHGYQPHDFKGHRLSDTWAPRWTYANVLYR